MSKNLIIVESPGKIKTLSKFLGKDYIIEASKGHVIDLPPSRIGVSAENGFVPAFHVVKDRKDVIIRLQRLAKNASKIYLAPDPDREGEAISWHLATVLDVDPLSKCRITFNSITKADVLKSLENPRSIDYSLVNAQQSRRILDRLVGYRLSPLLWQKICLGLSAGRVQSVAVALICRREREILAFIPEEYWTITADVATTNGTEFKVKLVKYDGKRSTIPNKEVSDKILAAIKAANLEVTSINKRKRRQNPPPPFITSTMQSEAAQRFGFTPRRTMSIAQKLYEGMELGSEGHVGLITYMRTDSVRIAPEGLAELQSYLSQNYDKVYRIDKPRIFKQKGRAQDAHEAIRPTSVFRTPELMAAHLKPEQLRLYTLIWRRYVASQMAQAIYEVVTADVEVDNILLQASGTTTVFDGFTSLYAVAKDEDEEKEADSGKQKMPKLVKGEALDLKEVDGQQHFTMPPPRYSESSVIKTLEKEGIGRPSTYAAIVETIQQRKYVKKVEGRFHPSDAAFAVTEVLEKSFADLLDPGFTATMEDQLDKIEDGELDWVKVLSDFYEPFMKALKTAEENIDKIQIPSDVDCPKCGANMFVRLGRTGKFMSCSAYPECRSTINIPDEILLFSNGIPEPPLMMADILAKVEEEKKEIEIELLDEKCEKCGSNMRVRDGRYGNFIACSNYPECKNARPIVKEIGVDCPDKKCGGKILEKKSKRGRIFYGCSNYPTCTVTTWSKPTGELCPDCEGPLVWHFTKRQGQFIKCSAKGCKYKFIPEDKEEDDEKKE